MATTRVAVCGSRCIRDDALEIRLFRAVFWERMEAWIGWYTGFQPARRSSCSPGNAACRKSHLRRRNFVPGALVEYMTRLNPAGTRTEAFVPLSTVRGFVRDGELSAPEIRAVVAMLSRKLRFQTPDGTLSINKEAISAFLMAPRNLSVVVNQPRRRCVAFLVDGSSFPRHADFEHATSATTRS